MAEQPFKIFCIGFNKSGTSSMHVLFQQWGMSSVHGMYSDWPLDDAKFDQYECFTDGEKHDFKALDLRFPNSRFILLSRRLDMWLVSRVRHTEIRKARNKTGWMRKEYEENPSRAIRNWIERRDAYYEAVNQYFSGRPDHLLPLNICDSKNARDDINRLAKFIGRDPEREMHEFPHLRASDVATKVVRGKFGRILPWRSLPRTKEAIIDEVETQLATLGIPEVAWADDGLTFE